VATREAALVKLQIPLVPRIATLSAPHLGPCHGVSSEQRDLHTAGRSPCHPIEAVGVARGILRPRRLGSGLAPKAGDGFKAVAVDSDGLPTPEEVGVGDEVSETAFAQKLFETFSPDRR
jgi:hypothetical protein